MTRGADTTAEDRTTVPRFETPVNGRTVGAMRYEWRMDSDTSAAIASAMAVARVRAVRLALLHVHKTLLDAERARYERERGAIDGPGHALTLVMNDPFFAWLRPIAALVVEIDERLADDAPLREVEVSALVDQT